MFFELLFAHVFLNRNVSVDLTCRVTYKRLSITFIICKLSMTYKMVKLVISNLKSRHMNHV